MSKASEWAASDENPIALCGDDGRIMAGVRREDGKAIVVIPAERVTSGRFNRMTSASMNAEEALGLGLWLVEMFGESPALGGETRGAP